MDFSSDDGPKRPRPSSGGMRVFIHQCLHTARPNGGHYNPGVPTGKYYAEISCEEFVEDGPAFAKEVNKEIFLGSAEWLTPCEMETPCKKTYLIPAKLKLTIFTDTCVCVAFSAPCCA